MVFVSILQNFWFNGSIKNASKSIFMVGGRKDTEKEVIETIENELIRIKND